MKIEIWSDVICPFCYIGKRNFETAMEQFIDKKNIEVIWRSYQLDPTIPKFATESYAEYLVKRKGMAVEQVQGMLAHVTQMASQVGLDYHLDESVIVNSLKAHQLIQFAKSKNFDSEAEERLFRAFFQEGKNIADTETLVQLGKDFGLDESEIRANLEDEKYKYEIARDIQDAQNIGVTGVPFFVFDRKYAISGAQPVEAFLENLNMSFAEWRKSNPQSALQVIEGYSCKVDGKCD